MEDAADFSTPLLAGFRQLAALWRTHAEHGSNCVLVAAQTAYLAALAAHGPALAAALAGAPDALDDAPVADLCVALARVAAGECAVAGHRCGGVLDEREHVAQRLRHLPRPPRLGGEGAP